VVGTILVEIADGEDIKIPLIAAEDAEESGFFKKYFTKIKYMVLGAD